MLKVLKAGFYTTIQDNGRFNYRNKGVPVSGAMDEISAQKVNALLSNDPNDAVLEITMTGPTLAFEQETYVVLGGADFSVTLNNVPIQNYKIYQIHIGDIISFGRLTKGFRAYLGVKGGFQVKKVMGSVSFYYPLTAFNRLRDHDNISYYNEKTYQPIISEIKVDSYLDEFELEVSKAPEFQLLDNKQLEDVFSREFTVAHENNRMAYQITEKISGHQIAMITSATLPGTVQLTPDGKMIVLMKDGQTTGGYPRILQLTKKAICILAQKRQGDVIKFKLI